MVKNDRWIREKAEEGMITPFVTERISSYGYDMTLADEYYVYKHNYQKGYIIDPKNTQESNFQKIRGDHCIIPPNSFVLSKSAEYFRIPRNILAICLGRSRYARCGIIVNVTPLEPEWHGVVTIEITNSTPLPAKVYANEGIAQLIFFEADEVCERSYADKKGIFQGTTDITPPRWET